jgi:hypothetical protein
MSEPDWMLRATLAAFADEVDEIKFVLERTASHDARDAASREILLAELTAVTPVFSRAFARVETMRRMLESAHGDGDRPWRRAIDGMRACISALMADMTVTRARAASTDTLRCG